MKRLLLCVMTPMLMCGSVLSADELDPAEPVVATETLAAAEQETVLEMGRETFYPQIFHPVEELFEGPRVLKVSGADDIILEEGVHIRLVDHSVWQVHKSDRYTVLDWKPGHLVVLEPNHQWTNREERYRFALKNINTGSQVAVRIRENCDRNMPTMPSLMKIGPSYDRYIELENGLRVQIVDYLDYTKVCEKWKPGDVMMLGRDKDWLGNYSNYLMNLKKKECYRVQWVAQ